MSHIAAYGGLFLSAFLAPTFIPIQSEFALGALVLAGTYSVPALFAVATVANVLGSVVNWVLGRFVETLRGKRWFPVPAEVYDRAERWYARFGSWSLLLAWAPFIGDPLTLVAGALRVSIWRFLVLVTIGKAARYAVLIAALKSA